MAKDYIVNCQGQVQPTRSAFSKGPNTGNRIPKLFLTTRSTVSASQIPASTMEIASLQSACCKRLPTKRAHLV